MRSIFPGWYTKSDEQIKEIWEKAIIVPDTNILLHLLRHSPDVRAQLFEAFERRKNDLWIPYQVGLEFQRRRLDVQHQALEAYDRLKDSMLTFLNQSKNSLNQYRAHPQLNVEDEIKKIEKFVGDFCRDMSNAKNNHPAGEFSISFEKVTQLFENKVGERLTAEKILKIHKDGADRYAKKIPPGFEDSKKTSGEGDKYGDLIIWMEIIEKAKLENRPVIFITDDGKSDWWYIHHGKKIGAHPALVDEFFTLTGQNVHIYELLQFLRYASNSGAGILSESVQKIADSIIAEIEVETRSLSPEQEDSQKALRHQLRILEDELDNSIKTLIEFPPIFDVSADNGAEVKENLKARVVDINFKITLIRQQLSMFDGDSAA